MEQCSYKPRTVKNCPELAGAKEARDLQKEHGPANTLISDF